ncbi:hypothetical protein RIF29_20590 [Crotalaria pallida]|uniref:Uncharacterized protein n=1 Tax=Crotalaria pallida TaxID=3830 RepID=A0AAN9I7N1_CROPI
MFQDRKGLQVPLQVGRMELQELPLLTFCFCSYWLPFYGITWTRVFSEKTTEQSIPVITAWQLDERMCGELQGLNKQETVERYGKDKVYEWRPSYDIPPPKGDLSAWKCVLSLNLVFAILPDGVGELTLTLDASSINGGALISLVVFRQQFDELSH